MEKTSSVFKSGWNPIHLPSLHNSSKLLSGFLSQSTHRASAQIGSPPRSHSLSSALFWTLPKLFSALLKLFTWVHHWSILLSSFPPFFCLSSLMSHFYPYHATFVLLSIYLSVCMYVTSFSLQAYSGQISPNVLKGKFSHVGSNLGSFRQLLYWIPLNSGRALMNDIAVFNQCSLSHSDKKPSHSSMVTTSEVLTTPMLFFFSRHSLLS